jgi:hypothetical protein
MARLADAALFGCGLYVSLRLIAATYSALDLWYTIRTAYPRVIRGILGWGGAALAAILLLHGGRRQAFVLGLLAFLVFYLSLYALRHLVVRRPAALE